MRSGRPRVRAGVAAVALLAAAWGGGACAGGREAPRVWGETRATMAEIVGSLQGALPLSLDAETFDAPENREALEAALGQLRRSADALEAHGLEHEPAFTHRSRRLAEASREIDERFRSGRTEEARFLLGELAETCVSCHTGLPGGEDSALGRQLYESVDADTLPPQRRLRLLVATRQFETALEGYEALFAAPGVSGGELDIGGFLIDYLRVCVRVRGDLERPHRELDRLRRTHALPPELDQQVATWVDALGRLPIEVPEGREIERARALLEEAEVVRRYPVDRSALVQELVASHLIEGFLEGGSPAPESLAEAYYLLGAAELRAGPIVGLGAPESYLEAAIRARPGSALAAEAYTLLEETTVAGFTGSSGTHLPPEERDWLVELRRLAMPVPSEAEVGP